MSSLRSAITLPKLKAEDLNDEEYDLIYVWRAKHRRPYTITLGELRKALTVKPTATKKAKTKGDK